MNPPFFVYFLESDISKSTYIGATVDVERRLRQHNKEIKGGAHATGMRVARGETWKRICYVSGFPDWPAALQFEWRWKQISRKLSPNPKDPLIRRLIALEKLLLLDKPTSKAVTYASWSTPPEIHWTHLLHNVEICDIKIGGTLGDSIVNRITTIINDRRITEMESMECLCAETENKMV
jgi:predicted GIY-YIG superfamily endonuclease